MARIHISLGVLDIDRSIDFYRQVFDQPPSKKREGYANFRVDEPPLMLALVEQPGALGRNDSVEPALHYGVELGSTDELASWRERVQAAGLVEREEKNVTCCYARADKVWLRDPDGNQWEFWVRLADADSMSEPAKKPVNEAVNEVIGQATRPACCQG